MDRDDHEFGLPEFVEGEEGFTEEYRLQNDPMNEMSNFDIDEEEKERKTSARIDSASSGQSHESQHNPIYNQSQSGNQLPQSHEYYPHPKYESELRFQDYKIGK